MYKHIAKIISVIFNPLIISPFVFYILIFSDHNINNYLFFLIALFFSSILPFSSILYFKKIGKISSFEAPIRKQRLELLIISSLYNLIAFFLLNYFEASDIVQGLMFCYAINTAVTVKASRNADKNAATKQNKRERCILDLTLRNNFVKMVSIRFFIK